MNFERKYDVNGITYVSNMQVPQLEIMIVLNSLKIKDVPEHIVKKAL